MAQFKHYYLIHLQFLGFRYHGWFFQKNEKTVQEMLDKTLAFILKHNNFKTLGCSRTDSKVSANHFISELFINESIEIEPFLNLLNHNFPPDIKALKIEESNSEFNIIQHLKFKEYWYLFAFGEKPHPFSAPLVVTFPEKLNINLMQQGAELFLGEQYLKMYCTKPSPNTNFKRIIMESRIEKNTSFKANFFPEETFIYKIKSNGFLRYQVRLILGQLYQLGKNKISLLDLQNSLNKEYVEANYSPLKYIAPATGLHLHKIET